MIELTPELRGLIDKIYNEHRVKFLGVSHADERKKLRGELAELQEAKLKCFLAGEPCRELTNNYFEEVADVLICCIRLIGEWADPEAQALFEKYFNYVTVGYILYKWEIVKSRTYKGLQHI